MEDGEEEEEEEEEEEDDDDDEEGALEMAKPKKRIGRPPKIWSSVLLPKEVTSTLGSHRPRLAQAQKANLGTKTLNPNDGEGAHSKVSMPNMVGQTVRGVVDGCFDAGFLISLRMGDSDSLFRGVVFGPGLSIPVSKETDVAKNVKRKRRNRKVGSSIGPASTKEPSSSPPLPLPAPPREEAPPPNQPAPTQTPHHEGPPPHHVYHPNSGRGLENSHISPSVAPLHLHQYAHNGAALHDDSFRSSHPHPEMSENPNPYMHSSSFPPRLAMRMLSPAEGYGPRRNFGHAMPSPSTPYGYNFAGPQGRPSTPLPPQYQGPPLDRGP